MPLIQFRDQHPGDELDHAVEFGTWLGDDTLSTLAVTIDSGITLGSSAKAPAISGTDVVLWLSGGASGTTYDGEVTVTTAGLRTKVQAFRVAVTDPAA